MARKHIGTITCTFGAPPPKHVSVAQAVIRELLNSNIEHGRESGWATANFDIKAGQRYHLMPTLRMEKQADGTEHTLIDIEIEE